MQVSDTIVSDGNSSPTYRWAIALHTIEVGVSLPIVDEKKDKGHPRPKGCPDDLDHLKRPTTQPPKFHIGNKSIDQNALFGNGGLLKRFSCPHYINERDKNQWNRKNFKMSFINFS